ncbi:hypothetical protein HYO65_gp101 [Tenacibaculum phage PTm1]|uniref:Uncharacterized protein n=2 Tax=Shirahamavirus PTm1 TaxID=2846435 RepID=A0A5S9HXD2_9CAUD|nr:hypothetical protein HYO65_gp101 [Tenacibaculum phage PTm1]BBI90493.1 hypothetical protein [Tenacibaculum phage PTm1]BBI90801.1 hypothetical protein [Tenacibaculum phage PTm5]
MKDNNSHKIPFKDLPKKAVNGTVVFNNVFYTITAVNSVEFVARRVKMFSPI